MAEENSNIAFKVCRLFNDRLLSLIMIPSRNGSLCRQYTPNQWAKPTPHCLKLGYGLTCFQTAKAAATFAKGARKGKGQMQIWKCEIGNRINLPLRGCDLLYVHAVNLKMIKAGIMGKIPVRSEKPELWPEGTIMVDKIKLIEFIENVDLDPIYHL